MFSLLYVDDEPALLEVCRIFLEMSGEFSVDTVQSGTVAMNHLEKRAYDAVVSDYQMPGMDGITLLKKIREKGCEIPFILFTGKGREDVVIDAINNGADFYLQKGGDPTAQFAELAHKVKQAVNRSRMEAALRESENNLKHSNEYLSQIFESIQAGIMITDATTHEIIDINPSGISLYGGTREDLIGRICHTLVCPAESGKCPITDLGLSIDNSERDLITKDGQRKQIIKHVSPITLTGRPCLLETFIDNSVRKEAELALATSEKKLADIIEFLPDATLAIDVSGRVIAWNRAMEEITGVPAGEMLGQGDLAYAVPLYGYKRPLLVDLLLNPKVQPENLYNDLKRTGTTVTAESVNIDLKGQKMVLRIRASILANEKGVVTGAIETLRNVTEQKAQKDELHAINQQLVAAEEELRSQYEKLLWSEQKARESEVKFRSLVEKSLDGIVITDLDGKILYANPRIGEIIEITSSNDLLGQANILDFVSPSFQAHVAGDLARVREGTDNFPVSYPITTRNNNKVWVECIGRIIPFESSPAMLLTIRDVTSRKLTEISLKKANEKLGILYDITRHDILNQLTVLNSCCILLEKNLADNHEASDLLKRILEAGTKIRDQISFTKDYQDMGKNEPVWQDISLIARIAADGVLSKTIRLTISTANVEIFADPMLMIVFYNIFDNILRHGKTVTAVSVTFAERGKEGLLIIEDNGIGVPEVNKAAIFERGIGSNTGLGLFLVREILEITGFAIHETGIEGSGARFGITIPPGYWRKKPAATV